MFNLAKSRIYSPSRNLKDNQIKELPPEVFQNNTELAVL